MTMLNRLKTDATWIAAVSTPSSRPVAPRWFTKKGLSTTPGAATAAHTVPRLPSTMLRFMARRVRVGVSGAAGGLAARERAPAAARSHRWRSAAAAAIIGPSGLRDHVVVVGGVPEREARRPRSRGCPGPGSRGRVLVVAAENAVSPPMRKACTYGRMRRAPVDDARGPVGALPVDGSGPGRRRTEASRGSRGGSARGRTSAGSRPRTGRTPRCSAPPSWRSGPTRSSRTRPSRSGCVISARTALRKLSSASTLPMPGLLEPPAEARERPVGGEPDVVELDLVEAPVLHLARDVDVVAPDVLGVGVDPVLALGCELASPVSASVVGLQVAPGRVGQPCPRPRRGSPARCTGPCRGRRGCARSGRCPPRAPSPPARRS